LSAGTLAAINSIPAIAQRFQGMIASCESLSLGFGRRYS
jgi:hypothetical protein